MDNEIKKEKEDSIWQPNLKWFLKVLITMYIFIIIAFFTLNFLLKPYMRDIPKEITPWLNKTAVEVQK